MDIGGKEFQVSDQVLSAQGCDPVRDGENKGKREFTTLGKILLHNDSTEF